MERLRATIEQYSRWQVLGSIYVDRIEAHLESDFSICIENAKALLESIGKEICSAKQVELTNTPTINGVLKKAFVALGYPNDDMVNKISGSLANIGQEIGNLRNEISPTSHGKPLDELRERNNKIDLMTREFLIDSTLTVARFLIRAFEERQSLKTAPILESLEDNTVKYEDAVNFNEFWDEAFGDFSMGEDYTYLASEILFYVDYKAYEAEYKLFKESEPELETGE